MSLSRHKQACRTVIDEYMHNANVLQSVSTIGKRRAMSPHDEQPSMYDINDDYECPSSRKAKSWLDKDTCDEVEDDSATEKIAFAGNYKEEFSSVDDDDGSDSVDDDDGSDVGDDIDDGTDNNDDANINDIDDGTDTSADADISLFSDNNDFPISEPLSCNNDDNNSETCATLQYSPPLFLDIAPSLSSAYRLQVQLNTLFDKNKASLTMHDEIINLFNEYIESTEFNRKTTLRHRKVFVAQTEKMFGIQGMHPTYGSVCLTDNTVATVPVFNAKTMILSLLHDPTLMRPENFAAGYDIFTGAELVGYDSNNNYGEVHTGDAWMPALSRYCGRKGDYMPVALIMFGDKSHTDLHGALSVEPVSFTLSLFNQSARNLPQFWRLLGYIPNLSAGKGEADRMPAVDKIQNEHNCLSYVWKSVRDIHMQGGILTSVMGRRVHLKIWIHYIIGDTEGNNKWLGHYPGNNRGIMRPYRDCMCSFKDMSKTNPNCCYTTLHDMEVAWRVLEQDAQQGKTKFQQLSRYPIKNALLHCDLPLSDPIHGPYRMTPPELLHTSGAGLIMYIFRVIAESVGGGVARDDLDKQHVRMTKSIRRQSERDFPRGATRNGIVDGSKCQASERRGNLFSLTCIVHTKDGLVLKEAMGLDDDKWRNMLLFFRQYLAMEEWFHSENEKTKVHAARRKISNVLNKMKTLFPRGEGTNGYNIPKMHGMTKMQFYMTLYGCGTNFFGGPGESSHKQFVKAPGLKTQRRVGEFACQTAKQYHHVMVNHHAWTSMNMINFSTSGEIDDRVHNKNRIIMEGRYLIRITREGVVENNKIKLNPDLVRVYTRDREEIMQNTNDEVVTGYTRARCYDNAGHQSIYYAHPCYRGQPWYDWAFVHFVERGEEVYYPSRIIGFVGVIGGVEAVIQCSVRPVQWSMVENNMFYGFTLGTMQESFVRVALSSFVFTLCVIKDYGGESNKYFVVLPKRGWGTYFGNDIG